MKPHRIYRVFGTLSDYDSHEEWTAAYTLERSRADELRAILERELDEAIAWCEEWSQRNPEPRPAPTASDVLSWQRENDQAIPPDRIRERDEKRAAEVGERLSHMLCAQRGGLHPNSCNERIGRSWTATYAVETMLDDPTARCVCRYSGGGAASAGLDLPPNATRDPACPFHGDA